MAAATQPAPPLASRLPWATRALARLIDRALAFDKADRWPDAAAMLEALDAAEASLDEPYDPASVVPASAPAASRSPGSAATLAAPPASSASAPRAPSAQGAASAPVAPAASAEPDELLRTKVSEGTPPAPPPRRPWALLALVVAVGGAGGAAGYFASLAEAPAPPLQPLAAATLDGAAPPAVPSAATAASLSASEPADAAPSAVALASAAPIPSMARAPRGPHPASAAPIWGSQVPSASQLPPFDVMEAERSLQRALSQSWRFCRDREGPTTIPAILTYSGSGAVKNITSQDFSQRSSCLRTFAMAAFVKPFNEELHHHSTALVMPQPP